MDWFVVVSLLCCLADLRVRQVSFYQGFFPARMRRLLTIPIPMFRNPVVRMMLFAHPSENTPQRAAIHHPAVSAHHIPRRMYSVFKCRFMRAGSSAAARQRRSSAVGSFEECGIGFMDVCRVMLSSCGACGQAQPLPQDYSSNLGFRISE